MVASGHERGFHVGEHWRACMFDLAAAPVHWLVGAGDGPAEGLNNCLVTQADTKDRRAGLEVLDRLQANTGLVWGARTRGQDDCYGVYTLDLFDRDRIVAHDFCFTTKLPEVPSEVVDKGVVVVDDQNHGELESVK